MALFLRPFEHKHVPLEGIYFISNHYQAFTRAFKVTGYWMNLPYAYHMYYIKRFSTNFMLCFKNKEIQWIVVSISKF